MSQFPPQPPSQSPRSWSSVCELTGAAMDALVAVEQALMPFAPDNLSPLEFRTLLWARCSLASLFGIRADETVADVAYIAELMPNLDDSWVTALLSD